MIVQTAPEGQPRFVITMAEHTAFAGELARAFGNDRFAPVVPADEALYIIDNHDAGWAGLDAEYRVDPATGLPYNLTETPFDLIMGTSRASPDYNEQRHPFCGLLSSMHSWGLYNGRYGLSDMVLLDRIAADNRAAATAMLAHEEARQARLTETLASDPDTVDLVEDAFLMRAYKQLQFFDTLALYFNRIHEGARTEAVFPHVPLDSTADVDVRVTPEGGGVYAFDPYPFGAEPLDVGFCGRYMTPVAGETAADIAASLATERQTVTLKAA